MKKIILIVFVTVLAIAGFLLLRSRFDMSFGIKSVTPGQIKLTNDSSDKISVEYKRDDKNVDAQLSAGEAIYCGSNGFVRIFIANKTGSYELTYPGDDSVSRAVTLSQIVEAAKKDSADDDLYIKKGIVGDIKVVYEEVLALDATY
jgi:hypothetical protein